MPAPARSVTEYTKLWYGELVQQANGINSNPPDRPRTIYREMQFSARIPAGVPTEVFRYYIARNGGGTCKSFLFEMNSTVVAFGVPGSKTQYQVGRLNFPASIGSSASQLGRISQTSTGTDPNPTYAINLFTVSSTSYYTLTVTTAVETYMLGSTTLIGTQ